MKKTLLATALISISLLMVSCNGPADQEGPEPETRTSYTGVITPAYTSYIRATATDVGPGSILKLTSYYDPGDDKGLEALEWVVPAGLDYSYTVENGLIYLNGPIYVKFPQTGLYTISARASFGICASITINVANGYPVIVEQAPVQP